MARPARPALAGPPREGARRAAQRAHDGGVLRAGRRAARAACEDASQPEPGLAILDFGKRDVGSDQGLPVPLRADLEVDRLWDQHARVRFAADAHIGLGERLGFGIRHPCTSVDRWRVLPLVRDDYTVSGALFTYS